ncbi:hypothetical protein [Gemmatimonas sp.]|jgi:hypothetical protein|uniref:hypothetical protein n=1 Tax=Gemmatimonas sp. TaxID=1962908 RepID=UPI0022C04D6F|nr:hypothetical protein [Gemmatimonas sp.]MCZ8204143.1 hypothetical protein [Gemmatimonas sp.]
MTSAPSPLPVHVVGIVRGREINAMCTIALDHDAVVLEWPQAAAWRLALDGIEGLGMGAQGLTVYLRDHDVLELTGDDALRPFALAVMDRVCLMPELTRGLRHFGAAPRPADRGAGGTTTTDRDVLQAAHDAWFGPLLAARRAVHGVSDPVRQVTLMDAAALTEAMTAASAQIAQLLAPADAAERRATEAAIEDEARALFTALERLRVTGDLVRHGATDTRFADWRRWVSAVQGVFASADEAWTMVAEIVREH